MGKFYYFFRTSTEQNNFVNFGIIHIILLLTAFFGSLLIIKSKKESRLFEVFTGSILLVQQLTLYLWYFVGNYNFIREGLPLFHCRIAILMLAIGLIFKKDFICKMGSYWGMFGSISALIFLGLDPFLFPHITQFSYFIGHILLLWGSVYLLFVKKIGMSKDDFKKILITTNLYHIVIFFVDRTINANYAYMKSSPIGIGNNLNPFLYGFIVMMIFNIVLSIEYIIINKKEDSSVEEFYEVA
ncbi:TIGR02206 family membrane protein [Romboutsia sp. MSSM.1001216sp_RTP31141st1_G3_RTP31141_220114]|uniref:YwaF family protein n=1 Tax=unclassified Romboutsia TaxID=2626894 RepID=UPI0031B5BE64